MALRASSAARPPSLQLSPPPKSVILPPKLNSLSLPPANSASLPATAILPLFALFAALPEARAEFAQKNRLSLSTQVESAIDQIQELGSNFFSTASQVIGAVTDAVKPALPIIQQAGDEAVKIASPLVSEASKKAQEAFQSSGIDTQQVVTAAKTVADAAQQTTKMIDEAKPIATSTVETISSAEPAVLLGAGGALVVAYFLLPPVFSAISFSFRVTRVTSPFWSEKDKDKAGIPRLPSSAKNKLISIPLEELPSKIRSLVRSVKKVEAELVALKISYLKKINKSSNIVILDSKGWLQSRLGTDSYNLSFAQVLSPSRVIPAAARRFGTSSSTKLLPGGSD
ncbi:Calcium sensing receptor, chloroplastic [Sesamum angolense]|uniref:Calcium sensing receptor, chloroplastic n=1 Tax=Sesamum angolense TaxID=2727404 RepID=A0AAE1VX69_9LAMI|nr:Calcium sensing receptor, chloroplastic [Sesamum angolense]